MASENECPKCRAQMERKGAIEMEEGADGYYSYIYLWQCPDCKNVEIR